MEKYILFIYSFVYLFIFWWAFYCFALQWHLNNAGTAKSLCPVGWLAIDKSCRFSRPTLNDPQHYFPQWSSWTLAKSQEHFRDNIWKTVRHCRAVQRHLFTVISLSISSRCVASRTHTWKTSYECVFCLLSSQGVISPFKIWES